VDHLHRALATERIWIVSLSLPNPGRLARPRSRFKIENEPNDDMYVDYSGDGYYLYNRGDRMAISFLRQLDAAPVGRASRPNRSRSGAMLRRGA
jgi:hypothetical protein